MEERQQRQEKLKTLHTKKEFDEVLSQGHQIRGSFFVLHYCIKNLSVKAEENICAFADNGLSGTVRLGLIVPKRFAKRAVTRSLIKRQCRAQFAMFVTQLPQGSWILRLKRPIDTLQWESASSSALKEFIRLELQSLLLKAIKQLSV